MQILPIGIVIVTWMQFCYRWKQASLRQRPLERFSVWREIYVLRWEPGARHNQQMSSLCKYFTKHRNRIYCRWNSLLCRGLTQVSVLHKSYLNTILKLHKSTTQARNFLWKNSLNPLKRMYCGSIYHSLLSNT